MTVVVVGIGADGWAGLTEGARRELLDARVIRGARRQLEYLPSQVTGDRRPWPSPLIPALANLANGEHVLASGDPMFYGIGATLTRHRPDLHLTVIPHLSSFALACARLGWPAEEVVVVSAVARDLAAAISALRTGRRVLVLSESGATPRELANLLRDAGVDTGLTVLEQLGGSRERTVNFSGQDVEFDDLNVIAVEPLDPIPHILFEHDGQITKDDVRAITVAALRPTGGCIWDFGAGSGSVGISWALAAGGSVVAVEQRADRAERVARNAARVGVRCEVVVADIAHLNTDLLAPEAIFIGGGLSERVAAACIAALPDGGRLVANTVTIEGQALATILRDRFGGMLTTYSIADLAPLGGVRAWQPRRPLVQWVYIKESV